MPKYILYLFFILLFTPQNSLASVSVNISNNGEDSTNKVSIKSNTSTNEQSSNTSTNTTDIIIKSNGEVKEYHGSDENIELKSSDGKSSVSINNPQNQIKPSTSSTPTEGTVAGVFKENTYNESKQGLWEYLKRELARIFSFFT